MGDKAGLTPSSYSLKPSITIQTVLCLRGKYNTNVTREQPTPAVAMPPEHLAGLVSLGIFITPEVLHWSEFCSLFHHCHRVTRLAADALGALR